MVPSPRNDSPFTTVFSPELSAVHFSGRRVDDFFEHAARTFRWRELRSTGDAAVEFGRKVTWASEGQNSVRTRQLDVKHPSQYQRAEDATRGPLQSISHRPPSQHTIHVLISGHSVLIRLTKKFTAAFDVPYAVKPMGVLAPISAPRAEEMTMNLPRAALSKG